MKLYQVVIAGLVAGSFLFAQSVSTSSAVSFPTPVAKTSVMDSVKLAKVAKAEAKAAKKAKADSTKAAAKAAKKAKADSTKAAKAVKATPVAKKTDSVSVKK